MRRRGMGRSHRMRRVLRCRAEGDERRRSLRVLRVLREAWCRMLRQARAAGPWVVDKFHWLESLPPIPYAFVPREWTIFDGANYYCAIVCSDPLCGCELGRVTNDDNNHYAAECARCGEQADELFADTAPDRKSAEVYLLGIVASEMFRVPFWDSAGLSAHLFGG